jgi:hypothetical protein
VKIQKIVDLCKRSGKMYMTETEDCQWIGNGYAIYPLYDLPELTAEELCTRYGITEEQQDKMILNDKRVSEYGGIDFGPIKADEEPAEVVKLGLYYGGTRFIMLQSKGGISFVPGILLSPYKEEIQFWRRVSSSGIEYFVLTAGMFVVGIVFPEIGIRANLAAEIKEVAERL